MSTVSFYFKIENWGYFLIIKVIYSHWENSNNTKNQTTYEHHMTTERSTDHTHAASKAVISLMRRLFTEEIRAKFSKPPLLPVRSLYIFILLLTLLCFKYRQLGIYISLSGFFPDILWSVLNGTKWMLICSWRICWYGPETVKLAKLSTNHR